MEESCSYRTARVFFGVCNCSNRFSKVIPLTFAALLRALSTFPTKQHKKQIRLHTKAPSEKHLYKLKWKWSTLHLDETCASQNFYDVFLILSFFVLFSAPSLFRFMIFPFWIHNFLQFFFVLELICLEFNNLFIFGQKHEANARNPISIENINWEKEREKVYVIRMHTHDLKVI